MCKSVSGGTDGKLLRCRGGDGGSKDDQRKPLVPLADVAKLSSATMSEVKRSCY